MAVKTSFVRPSGPGPAIGMLPPGAVAEPAGYSNWGVISPLYML